MFTVFLWRGWISMLGAAFVPWMLTCVVVCVWRMCGGLVGVIVCGLFGGRLLFGVGFNAVVGSLSRLPVWPLQKVSCIVIYAFRV
jgi:hypothetical protein